MVLHRRRAGCVEWEIVVVNAQKSTMHRGCRRQEMAVGQCAADWQGAPFETERKGLSRDLTRRADSILLGRTKLQRLPVERARGVVLG
jgi:hypothetical protein